MAISDLRNPKWEEVGKQVILKEDFYYIEGAILELHDEIDALEGRTTALEGRTTALEGRTTAAEGTIGSLQATVSALSGRVDAVEILAGRIPVGGLSNADQGYGTWSIYTYIWLSEVMYPVYVRIA